jgi:hypothetical protein
MHSVREVRGLIYRLVSGLLVVAFLPVLTSCGGTSAATQPPPPPASISVSMTSHPAGVSAGLSYQFAASVVHTANTAVSWSLACVSSCGSVEIGAVASNGTYVAPMSVAQPVNLMVTATSVAEPTKSASAQFLLMPAVQMSMPRAPSQIVLGFVHQFTADIQNDLDHRGMHWFVGDVAGGNATLGTIDSNGLYTAPAGSSEMIIAIKAKSVTDPTKTASADVALIVNSHPNFTGDYTFSFSGPGGFGMTTAAGILHLDGAGRLSATIDINSGLNNNVLLPGVAVTGFYGFEHNDLGHATLNYTVGQQTATMEFRLALLNDGAARLMEFDGQGQGAGMIEKQAGSGLSSSLDGPRVLALSGLKIDPYNPQVTILAAFTGANHTLSGIYDTRGYDQTAFTGTYSFGSINTLTLNLQGWSNTPVEFRVYPVSPDKAFIISTGMPVLSGVIEKQTGGPYSLQNFNGTWIFSLKSTDSGYHLAGVRLVRIQSDGTGLNASGDAYDHGSFLESPPTQVTIAQYSVAENGRGDGTAQFSTQDSLVWYWVTPDRGYIKSHEGNGEFFRQQGAPFSAASLQAPLSIVLSGYSDYFFLPKTDSKIGTGTPDGAGNFVLATADLDERDTAESIKMDMTRTGAYTIDSAGRGIISLDSGAFVLRFYAVSNTNLLLMRPGYDVIGVGTGERPWFASDVNLGVSRK